ncbi:MAG: hypothetical protein K9M51_01295 [Candidatus Gracilibacteria bacterium]|nr:hypothetical protein [Candidatus Gracilibacteria bacterium]
MIKIGIDVQNELFEKRLSPEVVRIALQKNTKSSTVFGNDILKDKRPGTHRLFIAGKTGISDFFNQGISKARSVKNGLREERGKKDIWFWEVKSECFFIDYIDRDVFKRSTENFIGKVWILDYLLVRKNYIINGHGVSIGKPCRILECYEIGFGVIRHAKRRQIFFHQAGEWVVSQESLVQ